MYQKIINHSVNICNVNSLFPYMRCSGLLNILKKNQQGLLKFTKNLDDGLLLVGKEPTHIIV